MDDKKTKVECRLITRGTDGANANVISDLNVPDPESTVGKQIIIEAEEKDVEDDDQSENS